MILAEIRENTMSSLFLRRALPWLAFSLLAINALFVQHPLLGLPSLFFFVLSSGFALGPRLTNSPCPYSQTLLGSLAAIALLSLTGCAVYYLTVVSTGTLLLAAAAVATLASATAQIPPTATPPVSTEKVRWIDGALAGVGIVALASWWSVITDISVQEAVRTPWQAVPVIAISALGLSFLVATTLLWRERTQLLGAGLFALSLFSLLVMTAAIYPLGYGFDPFLHRATLTHILEHGTITPKPLYYIGEYALELIAVKLGSLSLTTLNTLLVPFLAAFGTVGILLAREKKTSSHFALIALLLLPFGALVQTTPQALAFLFTVWCVLAPTKKSFVPGLFALAALFTHPLAGIPSAVYVTLLVLQQLRKRHPRLSRRLMIVVVALASIAIPVAFFLQAKIAGLPLSLNLSGLLNVGNLPLAGFLGTQFSGPGDIAYLFIGNLFLLTVVLAGMGTVIMRKADDWYLPGLTALTLFVNFIILSLVVDFRFLISYERIDFALRLLTLISLLLLPYLIPFFDHIRERLLVRPPILRISFFYLVTILALAQVYSAYPRHDNYARSAGFNVSATDMKAVHMIDQLAGDQQYIVLSDQALAAAAVSELGFKQYYHDDIFFYPIPTGGPLYQHFLSMVEEQPNLSTVTAAMDLAGVDLAFFAMHDYWWDSEAIIENTKTLTEDWFTLDEGAVTVFIFTR